MHSAIRHEVVAYRDWVVASYGEGPLFPDAVAGDNRRNTLASNQIMGWLRSDAAPAIKDAAKDFYS